MKTLLTVLAATAVLTPFGAAAELAPASMTQYVRDQLPSYDPAIRAEEVKRLEAEKALPEEAEVVTLPELTVQEKSIRRMEDDTLYRRGAWDQELVRRELSEFDRLFLNRFKIPLFGVSKEARARQAYLERKNQQFEQRLADYADVLQDKDPAEARSLRLVMLDTARSGEVVASNARPSNWR